MHISRNHEPYDVTFLRLPLLILCIPDSSVCVIICRVFVFTFFLRFSHICVSLCRVRLKFCSVMTAFVFERDCASAADAFAYVRPHVFPV